MTTAASRYAALTRNTRAARWIVDEEIAYHNRTWGHARACSRERLDAWGSAFPWVALHVAAALGAESAGAP